MHDDVVVGLDIGTSATKAVAYGRDGRVLRSTSTPTPVRRADGRVDIPVLEVVRAAEGLVGDLARTGARVHGLGVASMGEVGTVLTDDGRLADLAFPAWHDDRGSDVVAGVAAELGAAYLAAVTGGHFRPVSTVAKLAWLRRHAVVPPGRFLHLASLVVHRLTGVVLQEASLATTAGVVDPFTGSSDLEAWRRAGLGDVRLPSPDPAGTAATADGERASARGLVPGSSVVVAGHDHPVAAVGTGAPPGAVVDSMGTGEPLIAALTGPRPAAHDLADLAQEQFSVEVWPSDGRPALIAEGLLPGLAMNDLVRRSGRTHEELEARAPASRLVAGEVPDAPASGSTPEGWGLLLDHLAAVAAARERRLREVTRATGPTVLTGGGLRSRRWVSAKARVSVGELLVSDVPDTGTRGAAAVVGASLGWWGTADQMPGGRLVPIGEWLRPTETES